MSRGNQSDIVSPMCVDHREHPTKEIHADAHKRLLILRIWILASKCIGIIEHPHDIGEIPRCLERLAMAFRGSHDTSID